MTAKLRLGWMRGVTVVHELARDLVNAGADALTLHPRYRNEGFSGNARWEHITRLKAETSVPVIGNGDVRSAEDVFRLFAETGCDGVMIGRVGLSQPWIFKRAAALERGETPPADPGPEVRCRVILEHFHRLLETIEPHRAVHKIRGSVAWYTRGVTGGAGLRRIVNQAPDPLRFEEIIKSFYLHEHGS